MLAVTAMFAGVAGWNRRSVPPLIFAVPVVENGRFTFEANVPPPLMASVVCEFVAAASNVPRPDFVKRPVPRLILPPTVRVAPDATSMLPARLLVLLTARGIKKELVTRRVDGTVVEAWVMMTMPLLIVSPRLALLLTL